MSFTDIKPKEEVQASVPSENKKKKPKVVEHKQTFGEKIADNFASIDHGQIKNRLIFDWLFPEIISLIDDFLRMVLLGGKGRGTNRNRNNRSGYTSYNSIYDAKHGGERDIPQRDPTRQDFRRIRLEFYEREDAEDVLDDLRESLEESKEGGSGWVTVKELYSLAEMPTNSTMYKWGWQDLDECIIERLGDNYVLEMPRAEVIR